jgi:hypothetical protein
MALDRSKIIHVVYDPPQTGFPYLSATFLPGQDHPEVLAFDTAELAEEFNRQMALKALRENS